MATFKEFKTVKNEKYTVIFFRDGRRVLTISACDIIRANEEMVKRNDVAMMFKTSDITATQDIQRDIDFFINLKKEINTR